MRPRLPPAPAVYDERDQNELRRVLSDFINVTADVQADPNEVAAPRFASIKQSAGGTPATQTDVVLTIENGGGWGGTLSVWTNPSSVNDADATASPDGTFAVSSCPAVVGPTTVFNLTGGGTGNLLNDIGVHPGRGKRIYALFEDVNGSSTGIWSFVLTSQSGPVDGTNTLLAGSVGTTQLVDAAVIQAKIADAAVNTAKFAAGIRPVRIVTSLPGAGDVQGDTVFLTTDNKLYRWTGTAWTAAVATADLTGTISTTQLADGSVTTVKLGDAQVTTAKLVDGSVTTAKIGNLAVTTTQLADGAVTTVKVGDNQVSTAKLIDGSVVATKMADASVDLRKIATALVNAVSFVDARNKLFNPSFEDGASYWSTGAGIVIQTNSANAKTGNKYAELTASTSTDIHQFDDVGNARFHEVRPGDVIKWGVWAQRVSGDGGAQATLVSCDKDKASAAGHATNQATTNGVWVLCTGEYTAGATDKYVRFKLTANGMSGSSVYRFDDAFLIIETPGADIVARSITADRIVAGSITANEIAALTIQAGNIAARSISIEKLFVGSFDNLVQNGTFEQSSSSFAPWTLITNGGGTLGLDTSTARSGTVDLSFNSTGQTTLTDIANGDVHVMNQMITAAPGDGYYCELYTRKLGGGTPCNVSVKIQFLNASGTEVGSATSAPLTPTTAYQKVSLVATAPTFTAFVAFRIRFEAVGGATETVLVDDVYARRMVTGSIVVDGTITAQQIAAATITAAQIASGTIVAGNIAANTITAAQIAANTITAGQIAANTITAAQIAADTITAGQIAASAIGTSELASHAITTDKLFVGSYDNLIPDPGFEQGAAANVNWWNELNTGGTLTSVSTNPRSGSRSGAIVSSSGGYVLAGGASNNPAMHPSAAQGDQFYYELWFRQAAAGSANRVVVGLQFRDSTGASVLLDVSNGPVSPTTSYQKLSVTATAPAGTAYVLFYVQLMNDGFSNTIHVDDAYARRMATGDIIVDGTITATKLAVTQLSAITANMGTLTAGLIQDASASFIVDLNNLLLTIKDTQASPITRVQIGKLGGGADQYGLKVYDAAAATIMDFTGQNRVLAIPVKDQGAKSADFTIDLSTGLTQMVQLGASGLNLTLSNPVNGGRYRIWFQQDVTGSRSFPNITNAVMYTNGAAPTLTATPGAFDVYEFEYRSSPTPRFTCMPLQTNVLLPSPITANGTTQVVNPASTTHNATMPATVAAGDLLLIVFQSDSSQGTIAPTTPGGWTSLAATVTGGGAGTGKLTVFAKVAAGTEGGTAVNVATVANCTAIIGVYRITQWHGSLTDLVVATAAGTSTTPDSPSVTASWTDRTLWLSIYGTTTAPAFSSAPANYSNTQRNNFNSSLAISERRLYATAENPGNYTVGASADWGAVTIAIRPVA